MQIIKVKSAVSASMILDHAVHVVIALPDDHGSLLTLPFQHEGRLAPTIPVASFHCEAPDLLSI